MRIEVLAIAALLLVGCGGGSEEPAQPSYATAVEGFSRAQMAREEVGACPASDHAMIDGRCMRLFEGMTLPSAADGKQLPTQSEGGSPKVAAAAPVLTPTAFFNWVSGPYAYLFAGSFIDGSISLPGYGLFIYRYFSYTGNFIAVMNGWVYVYGPITAYTIIPVGSLSSYTCYVYSCARSFITWTGNANGVVVKDANGDSFAFYSDTGCLYSYGRDQEITNYCLVSGGTANFAGTYVYVTLAAGVYGGCVAVLENYYGYQVDIYTSFTGQLAFTTTAYTWNRAGCG